MSHQKFFQHQTVIFGITFLVAFFVYFGTMPSGLTFAHYGVDGGDLITASVTLGIPHPPGYPLYVILGKAFSYLPIGSIAFRFNLLSALAMAGSAGVITLISATQWPHANQLPSISIPIGLSYAFAPLIWQQAIITEVYGLLMLFLSLTLYSLMTKKSGWQIGLFWGLSVTSHLTAVFFAPLLLYHLYHHRQQAKHLLFGTLIGLTPFFMLPLFALSNSPIKWGNPLTLSGFFNLVSADIYRDLPFAHPIDLLASRLKMWGIRWATQFTLAGIPLLLVSFGLVKIKEERLEMGVWLGTAVLFLTYALFYNSGDAIVFSLPAFMLMILLMRKSLAFLNYWAFLLPLTLILLNFSTVNINQDRFVHQQLEYLLEQVPPNALLETSGEAILFPLWYVKFVEHQRDDILLIDNQLFTYSWYRNTLKAQDDSLTTVSEDFMQFQLEQEEKRPYCNIDSYDEKEQTMVVNCQQPVYDQ